MRNLIDSKLNYRLESELLNLFHEGRIVLNEPVFFGIASELDKYICKLSYKYPDYAFRVSDIDETDFWNKYSAISSLCF